MKHIKLINSRIKALLCSLLMLIIFHSAAFSQSMLPDSLTQSGKEIKQIAYGSQPQWMISQSVSSVKGTDLEKSFNLNVANSLYGRIPGLTVMQGGSEPGAQSPTLRIRGVNTFGTGTGVLVIVDGFEGTFEQLLPDEIESISVLKDAAATAIYGSKGANGVLLVTTKRGNEGKLQIGYSAQIGFSSAIYKPKLLGSYDYARLYNEALVNDGKPVKYTDSDLSAYQTGNDPYFHPDVNWYNEILRKTAPVMNYNMNFRGGNSVVKYFVMLNYINSESLLMNTGNSNFSNNSNYGRFNFRSNLDIQLSKNLSSTLILGSSIENKKSAGGNTNATTFDLATSTPPNVFPVYNSDGTYGGSNSYNNVVGNLLELGLYSSNTRNFQGTLKLTQKLDMVTKGLSLSGAISFNNSFTSLSNKTRTYKRFNYSKVPDRQGNDSIVVTQIGIDTDLASNEGTSNVWRSLALRWYLNYDRSFGENKISSVMMYNSSNYSSLGMLGGLPYRDQGLFGRHTYTYKDKYIAEFSFGFNGSESFPKDRRWGFFPAGSLGWVASNENFLKNSETISFLKFRGSYGMVGNDNIGGDSRYLFLQDYVGGNGYYFGDKSNVSQGGLTEGQLANPYVTWEKQKQLNIGVELSLWNKLDITVDVFNQDRFDILTEPNNNLPLIAGMNKPQLNLGKTNNKGFEAAIQYNGKISKDFEYFVQTSVWYARNVIEYNSEAPKLYDWLLTTGRRIGQAYRYEAIGFLSADDISNMSLPDGDPEKEAKPTFTTDIKPGDIKYKDQNGDFVIDANDRVPTGKTGMPELTAGLNAGLKYKGFDLEMVFQGVTNRTVYLTGNYYQAFQGFGTVTEVALNRWTPATAETATYPRLSSVDNLNNFQGSTFWQRDGSFIKLRLLEFGYSLPQSLIKKLKVNSARIFANGTNLFSIDYMDFTDPESMYGYPVTRTLSLGARFNF